MGGIKSEQMVSSRLCKWLLILGTIREICDHLLAMPCVKAAWGCDIAKSFKEFQFFGPLLHFACNKLTGILLTTKGRPLQIYNSVSKGRESFLKGVWLDHQRGIGMISKRWAVLLHVIPPTTKTGDSPSGGSNVDIPRLIDSLDRYCGKCVEGHS